MHAWVTALWVLIAVVGCSSSSTLGTGPGDIDRPPADVDAADPVEPPADDEADTSDAPPELAEPDDDRPADADDAPTDETGDGFDDGADDDPEADDPGEPEIDPADDDDDGPPAGDDDAAEDDDERPEDDAFTCPPPFFDYRCDAARPQTCPGGFCVLSNCVGPVLDQNRWAACGDGTCAQCEDGCPADCGPAPQFTGEIAFVPDETITVVAHGFSSVSDAAWETMVYGSDRRLGGQGDAVRRYAPGIPDGASSPAAKNQIVSVEYYGAVPAPWLSPEDVAEIERWDHKTAQALHRYALIVAKFIRRRLTDTGARYVNLLCHSMGCHIERYIIENDIEGLAGERRFVRWATGAGVVAGARLARLFDNPTVRQWAGPLGLNTQDFIHMNPDYVDDYSAWYDHKRYAANNPRFRGMLIHHLGASKPTIAQALGIRLLDLSNPGDEPNDGIMYTFDEMFWTVAEANRPVARSGRALEPTRTFVYEEHQDASSAEAGGIIAAAALYHRRKVYVTITGMSLFKDFESKTPFDGRQGAAPAEVVLESAVNYNPFAGERFGRNPLVHEARIAHRTAELWRMSEGEERALNVRVFEGPVFDEQPSIRVAFSLIETDAYNRWGVNEALFGLNPDETLIDVSADYPLQDAEYSYDNANVALRVAVRVETLY